MNKISNLIKFIQNITMQIKVFKYSKHAFKFLVGYKNDFLDTLLIKGDIQIRKCGKITLHTYLILHKNL